MWEKANINRTLRSILSERVHLEIPVDRMRDEDDLYAAGLSSLVTVHILLAVEDEFGIEIPDEMLTRELFQSIANLSRTIAELVPVDAVEGASGVA